LIVLDTNVIAELMRPQLEAATAAELKGPVEPAAGSCRSPRLDGGATGAWQREPRRIEANRSTNPYAHPDQAGDGKVGYV
jgi:hypothetical protein